MIQAIIRHMERRRYTNEDGKTFIQCRCSATYSGDTWVDTEWLFATHVEKQIKYAEKGGQSGIPCDNDYPS
ncbi:hypothetical protein HOT82_gp034 [Gordonia phage Ronaldo]|uniref:Uncharacterized protein n=4 Tax=Ronaldovirus TaxID=2733205 RepID=A0A6B9LGN7_9CAUD|nr:hypothetical protein HOT81_gp031 [Gordonia phage Fryberger]YP_009807730.1 hypothetical protein HOT82_gp034 [Gordonia phage Ronaldo]QDH48373.1 hypothetical protein SEA_ZIKO_34 [Gordonia phage Ziko]QHB38265.1 hypothetical protein SEA_VOLT_33 [Gordonia phage Volt]AXN53449.1 hypothetical protein SEA_FRYBERGER_31 [Gordonia phage Fryberger]AXN53596.1 hypothetical protein SEA_RONALDO_34 [Gordonia phage Ronaldo]